MIEFIVQYEREVVEEDSYAESIQAETLAAARAAAETAASDMNHECPDGVVSSGVVECRSWKVVDVRQAVEGETLPRTETTPSANITLDLDAWRAILLLARNGNATAMPDAKDGIAAITDMVARFDKAA